MRISIILHVITIASLLGLAGYVFLDTSKEKTAFVNNQTLFDKFQGTIELKAKLKAREDQYRSILDSIAILIKGGRTDLNTEYRIRAEEFTQQHQEMTEQYTADIWKTINAGVLEFGKANGYDYILGAAGNGSLMYAKEEKDLTDDVAAYLNTAYDGKKP